MNPSKQSPRRVSWSIVFDRSGLNATDARMLAMVVDADLRLMRLVEDATDARSEEALVRKVKHALATRFPRVAFHVLCSEDEDP
jgi:hypothetical protein